MTRPTRPHETNRNRNRKRKTKTMTMTLQQAIDRSRSHAETVSVEFAAEGATKIDRTVALEMALADIYDGEIDSANENDGTIDIWGWTEDMADGEMEWRLKVTLTEAE